MSLSNHVRMAGVVITFLAALWLRLMAARGQLRVWHLGLNGAFYLTIALSA